MKLIVVLVCLGLAGFYFGPTLIERADSQCDALVASLAKIKPPQNDSSGSRDLAAAAAKALGPSVAKKMIQERYPDLPPQLVCAGLYWKALVDPVSLQNYRPR